MMSSIFLRHLSCISLSHKEVYIVGGKNRLGQIIFAGVLDLCTKTSGHIRFQEIYLNINNNYICWGLF